MQNTGSFQQCPLCGIVHPGGTKHICDPNMMQDWHAIQHREQVGRTVRSLMNWALALFLLRIFWGFWTGN